MRFLSGTQISQHVLTEDQIREDQVYDQLQQVSLPEFRL